MKMCHMTPTKTHDDWVRWFWERVEKRDPWQCWQWTGYTVTSGTGGKPYGQMRRNTSSHRFSYELANGPIPKGLDIDHLCRNTLCVNPNHMEVVTRRENVMRGIGPAAINARKKFCKHGHPLFGENVYHSPKEPKKRYCRQCRYERGKAFAARMTEEKIQAVTSYQREYRKTYSSSQRKPRVKRALLLQSQETQPISGLSLEVPSYKERNGAPQPSR